MKILRQAFLFTFGFMALSAVVGYAIFQVAVGYVRATVRHEKRDITVTAIVRHEVFDTEGIPFNINAKSDVERLQPADTIEWGQ